MKTLFQWTKVNFFQKSLDTRIRNFKFSFNQGNYFQYLMNRFQWYVYPNFNNVSPFPLHVDIETSARCDLRCPMCASRHIDDEKYNRYGHMDFDLYKDIVDECATHQVFSVRLSWRGEVFTNPDFLNYVRYAKVEKKIPQVSFLTNGFQLKKNIAQELIRMGVDYISVSVDGMDDMYEKIRFPARFDDIYENLVQLKTLRQEMGKKKPLIRITTLWPAIANCAEAYYAKMSRVSDMIVYNPLKDYTITTQDRMGFTKCQFLWERLFVGFDGSVHPCSNTKDEFQIGSVRQHTLKEIWRGPEMTELRSQHMAGKRLEVSPCNTCSYGVDYEKRWKNRDWRHWDPSELIPKKDSP
ncbi:MAG: radical SAM/SPASM domain-containing protein [Candidatus Omnitrophota bacterium]